MKKMKVLLGMSGGVDSSVAAMLLQNEGYEVVGITMKNWKEDCNGNLRYASNKSMSTIEEAASLAKKMGIEHHAIDFSDFFEKNVIQNFVDEYLCGRTPNPCVLCNKILKWGQLLAMADELGCEYVSTGHYANIRYEGGRYVLSKGLDATKDQSYMLWRLPQEDLARTIFPLGNLNKFEIKEIARKMGFIELSEQKESYDVCFIPDNDYRNFLREWDVNLDERVKGGEFVLKDGKVVGNHDGFPFYTIGQRKGLRIALGEPAYVTKIDVESNRITLGSKDDVMGNHLRCNMVNSCKYELLPTDRELLGRIRYKDGGTMCKVSYDGDVLDVVFKSPVSAITAGQSIVFYEGDDVVGGGIIM